MCSKKEEREMAMFLAKINNLDEKKVRELIVRAKMKLGGNIPLEELYANQALYGFETPAELAAATKISLSLMGMLPTA